MIYIALFICSIYGCYFGADLGIILLAITQTMGFSGFHIANSIIHLLATSFTIFSIMPFRIGGLIARPKALTMMVGSTSGGYLGRRQAKQLNQNILSSYVINFGLLLSTVYSMRTYC
ncbi:hypothetical protein OAN307_c44950 [Octadecabacter antarcticus 307]|uniref:Membrane transporter protein n=1 Tax=Octadecabacter antarcticus 307 TaxID=391626 RepID=M9RDL7_9RHOB|nr:hypothetical protein [Octadecabacter antarcticus]AGI69853.1 hypothetical protein OAN307_c44950 [Octadecabacter antarcticus 307]